MACGKETSLILGSRSGAHGRLVTSSLVAFVGGLLLGAFLLNLSQIAPHYSVSAQELLKFSSHEEMLDFVNENVESYYQNSPFPREVREMLREIWGMDSLGETLTPDYSLTNIQVAGVDEADIVKTDGEYLYVLSNSTVFILKAYPHEKLQILSSIKSDMPLYGLFVNEDKMLIFGYCQTDMQSARALNRMVISRYWFYHTPRTFIKVFDVSNATAPVLTRHITLDGAYFDSRMIGDYVYAIMTYPVVFNETEIQLPIFEHDNQVKTIAATDIYYTNITDYDYTFTTVVAINIQNDAEEPTFETIMVGSTYFKLYVSRDNIYISLPGEANELGVDTTLIYRIHVENGIISCEASGQVPGRVLNQFSMGEYNGHFRIATTTGSLTSRKSRNHVYVLSMNLDIVGRLEGLAPGEKIYSARFMGDKFYLVTFRKVDPLFVIDLHDPRNPKVLGELKVTGYSDYLHPYDVDHVIGVGKETIAAEEGDFSWYQGVKISLFDVSDPLNPTEVDKDEIGDRGTTSPVLSDHKAFLFSRERQLLVIPVLVAEIDESKYPEGVPSWTSGDYVWQGAYVYNITTQGLELRGTITHIENGSQISYFSPYSVKRTLFIDDVLYTISGKAVKMNSLATLEEIGKIELP